MSIKKRTSKLYRSFGKMLNRYVLPIFGWIVGLAITGWISHFIFNLVLTKTENKVFAWASVIVFLLIVIANDTSEKKSKAKRKEAQEPVTRQDSKPVEFDRPPTFEAGDAEFEYTRVPKF